MEDVAQASKKGSDMTKADSTFQQKLTQFVPLSSESEAQPNFDEDLEAEFSAEAGLANGRATRTQTSQICPGIGNRLHR